jgi:hypothetical protein
LVVRWKQKQKSACHQSIGVESARLPSCVSRSDRQALIMLRTGAAMRLDA